MTGYFSSPDILHQPLRATTTAARTHKQSQPRGNWSLVHNPRHSPTTPLANRHSTTYGQPSLAQQHKDAPQAHAQPDHDSCQHPCPRRHRLSAHPRPASTTAAARAKNDRPTTPHPTLRQGGPQKTPNTGGLTPATKDQHRIQTLSPLTVVNSTHTQHTIWVPDLNIRALRHRRHRS